eukprot:1856898-Alexandrium_andersonii.AAC.1
MPSEGCLRPAGALLPSLLAAVAATVARAARHRCAPMATSTSVPNCNVWPRPSRHRGFRQLPSSQQR